MNQSDFKLKYAGANNGIIVKTNSSETKLDTSNYEITKKTYIPLEFAESTINALNEDRIDIKNRLEERIRQYQEKILTMEREYKAIIIELRDNAKRHIEVQDLIRKKIEQEKDLQIENLNETIKTLKQEHLEVVDELYKKLRQLELDYHEMCDKFTDVNIEKECLTALYEIKLEIQGSLISELQSNIANENVMLEDFRVRYRNEIENFEREIKYLKEQLVIRTSAFQDYKDKSIQDVVGLLLNDVIHKIEVAAARQEIANVSIVDDTLKDGIIASITESLSSARQEIENLLEEKNLRMEVNSSILDVLSKVELQDQDSKMALYSDLQEKYAALEYEYQLLIDLNSSLNRELLDAKTDDTPKSPTVRFQDSPIASPSQRGLLTRGLSKTIDDNDKLLFEQLQDDYVELQEELEKVVQETTKKIAELEDECNFAKQQLENLTVEKRTDIVKKYEEEIIALRQSVSKQSEELSAKKADIFRLEKRIEELQHRALSAEEEIKERDAQELAKLNTNEEKAQLRIKLNKQRDEIILKSKAVTAGWDAAAKADERVEVEVEKAYYRGFQEGKEQHTDDMKSLNDAIELKENRLTELVVKLNEMESRVREADLSSEKYRQEAENAKKETSDTISMFMSLQESMQSNSKSETTDEVVIGHTNDEFESLQSTLDKAHDEIISITDRYDQLSQKLELSEQRVSTYVRLLSLERQRLTDTLSKVESKQNTNSTVSLSKMSKELEDVINLIQATIQQGSALWKNNKREECFDLYLQAHDNLAKKLSNYRDLQEIVQSKAKLARSQVQAKPRDKPRAVEVLKQSMDKVVKSIVEKYGTSSVVSDTLVVTQNQQFPRNEVSDSLLTEIRELETQVAVLEKLYDPKTASKTEDSQINVEDEMKPPIDEVPTATDVETPLVSLDLPVGNESQPPAEVPLSPVTEAPIISDEASKMTSILQRAKDAEEMVEKLKKQIAVILSTKTDDAEDSTKLTNANPTTSRREKMMEAAEIRKLQKKIRELELQVQHFKSQVSSGNAVTDKKALLATEKQYQRKLKDLESQSKKDIQILESKNIRLEKSLETTNMMLDPITKERDLLRAKVTDMDLMSQELTVFRNKEKDFIVLQEDYSTKCSEYDILLEQFKKENNLRKKYKNELEDLKGAVRVFARCRPMAGYEIERGCKQVVQFKDEFSMKLFTSRGERDYEFDAVFGPDSKQEQVFEDAKRLVESCIDGYNTSIFAYGQTGSGKTFTMTGSRENPGLTPRCIQELFDLMKFKSHCDIKISSYFVELYMDSLIDLYWPLDNKNKIRDAAGNLIEAPKLEIKMDSRKMVVVGNAVMKSAQSFNELMALYDAGSSQKHMAATKMNATSSRSHSIFAILIESYDKTSKKTTYGKLSLIDLAGSERQSKTGATGEALKEGQAINQSLSALGNVIAALSEGEKHIPYRSHKLTQLMQDSLGGNAKTLMFVNFSPADYNCEETYSSLNYAVRAKKIINNANKQVDDAEILKLKQIIKKLQAGQQVSMDEINGSNPEANDDVVDTEIEKKIINEEDALLYDPIDLASTVDDEVQGKES